MGPLVIRTDPEASVRALAQAVARQRGDVQTVVETSAPGSHSSVGGVERFFATLHGAIRVQAIAFKEQHRLQVNTSSP